MTTIYMPFRCYGPGFGHYGWLFKGPDGWYAGSLEMPNSTAPEWLPCKARLDSFEDALDWFRRGGPAPDPPADAEPSPYCAIDIWVLDGSADLDAGVAAHHAAGIGTKNDLHTNNCLDEALRVLQVVAGRPLAGANDRQSLSPVPAGCSGWCR